LQRTLRLTPAYRLKLYNLGNQARRESSSTEAAEADQIYGLLDHPPTQENCR
jgi:hypothetical protein